MAHAKNKEEFENRWNEHLDDTLRLNSSLEDDDERQAVRSIVESLRAYVRKAANISFPERKTNS